MKKRFLDYICSHNMIRSGDIVCAGVSGGPDSVCLFLLLEAVRSDLDFELRVFHVNHHLRGKDSDDDAAFVRTLCRDHRIRLYEYDHNVERLCAELGKGTEETGRLLRIKDAGECLASGCTKIALAHHKNDQAETFLFNLSRGTSLAGLTGIRPVNGSVIHPMLCFSRDEILSFLKENNCPYRTDQSNADTVYTRNFLRHRVIADLESHVNSQAVDHINAAAEDLLEIYDVITGITDQAVTEHTKSENGSVRLFHSLNSMEPFIQKQAIAKCLSMILGSSRDITRRHIESIYELFSSRTGSRISLPGHVCAVSSYGDVILQKERKKTGELTETPFYPEQDIRIGSTLICSEFVADPSAFINEKNKYTKCFDYDRIADSPVIRTRRPGDVIVIDRNGSTKKLKDYFIDIKMERSIRDTVLLLATGNVIHWIFGWRMGESAKISPGTRKYLKITIKGNDQNES